jgi:hypothetical protein
MEQANLLALTDAGAVLPLQRAAVRAFNEAENTRGVTVAAAEAAHAAAASEAGQVAARRRSNASQAQEDASKAALAGVQEAMRRKDAVLKEEVAPAVKQAHEARDKVLPILERAAIGWIRDPERVDVPAAPDAGARLKDAVARTEAGVQPLINAGQALEKWNQTRARLLSLGVIAAFLILIMLWAVYRQKTLQRDGTAVSTTETRVVPAVPAPAPPTAVPPTESVLPRITLQYQARQDAGKVAEIQRALQQRDGWRVGSPEQVLPDAVNRAEVYGGVRFFFEEDSVLARSVCEVIRKELAERGYDVTFPLWPMVTLQRQGHFRARRGLIEVWVSPLPSPITGGDPTRMGRCGR